MCKKCVPAYLFCMHSLFFRLHAWADVMQRLSVPQQYPPSVSFAAHSKEAGPLCVCQPSSLGPIVKLNKLVCSGNPLTYGGGTQVQGKGGGEKRWGIERVVLEGGRKWGWGRCTAQGGRQKGNDSGWEKEINFIVWGYQLEWLNDFPPCPHPFPSLTTHTYSLPFLVWTYSLLPLLMVMSRCTESLWAEKLQLLSLTHTHSSTEVVVTLQ